MPHIVADRHGDTLPRMALVIGLDVGTSSCKAVALSPRGAVAASASGSYPLHMPRPGWAAQSAVEVWRIVAGVLRQVAERVGAARVAGITISGAMHSVLPVDGQGQPLADAMTWADSRSSDCLPALDEATRDALYRVTGCPWHSTYHVARLRWHRREHPQATCYVAIKDFVLHQLTRRWVTDSGLASSTGLFDIHLRRWHAPALSLAGIRGEQLCAVVEATDLAGHLSTSAAEQTGLPQGLPVIAGGSDGALANLGARALRQDQTVVSIGTSGAVRMTCERPRLDSQHGTWCYIADESRWIAGGAINNAGLLIQWLHGVFYNGTDGHDPFQHMMENAATIAPGAEGVLILPYLAGERSPHWREDLTAAITGLTLRHTRAHMARAGLEAVAYALRQVWLRVSPSPNELVRMTGGGARYPLWVQIVADVLGTAVQPRPGVDASALGAAMLGHVALKHLTNLEEFEATDEPAPVAPDERRHARYCEAFTKFVALQDRAAPHAPTHTAAVSRR